MKRIGQRQRSFHYWGIRTGLRTPGSPADNSSAISASRDGTVRYWSITGNPLHSIAGEHSPVSDVAYSPDGADAYPGWDIKRNDLE